MKGPCDALMRKLTSKRLYDAFDKRTQGEKAKVN